MIRLIAFILALLWASTASANEETITIKRNEGAIDYLGTYNWVSSDDDLQEGLMTVRFGKNYFHICSRDGLPAYKKELYDEITPFSGGFAAARKGKRWFHIYRNGTRPYGGDFDNVGLFRNGVAHAWEDGEEFYIGTDGKLLTKKYAFLASFKFWKNPDGSIDGEAKGQLKKNGAWETIRFSKLVIKKDVAVVSTQEVCSRPAEERTNRKLEIKRKKEKVRFKLLDDPEKEEFPRARDENGGEFHLCPDRESRLYETTYTNLQRFVRGLAFGKEKESGQTKAIKLADFEKRVKDGCPPE